MSLVLVLFVSETFATRENFKDYFVQESSENENEYVDGFDESIDVHSISENFSTEELEPLKRSKKSYYSQSPCNKCSTNEHQYDQRPTTAYGNSEYQPIHGGNYYNSPPKDHYHASAPAYSPPAYNAPNYQQPYAPAYSPPTYNAQSYQQPNAPVPAYSPPTYNAPSSQQHAYTSHNNNKYPAHVYQSPSNFYPHQPRPSTASTKLLIGCNPHVLTVPDMGYLPQYGHSPPYGHPHNSPPYGPHHSSSQQHSTHDYRVSDSSVSATKDPDFNSNETKPEKVELFVNNEAAPGNSAKNAGNDEKNEINKTAYSVEKPKETPSFVPLKNQLQSTNKLPPTEEKQTKEPSAGKSIVKRNYQQSFF